MKRHIDTLAMRFMAFVPYAYAVMLGILLQQLIGGAK